MGEAICGILATVCLDVCAGICFDFASTRKLFLEINTSFNVLTICTNARQAAPVQKTFALVHVVDAWATKMLLSSDNLWLILTPRYRSHNLSPTPQCKFLINNTVTKRWIVFEFNVTIFVCATTVSITRSTSTPRDLSNVAIAIAFDRIRTCLRGLRFPVELKPSSIITSFIVNNYAFYSFRRRFRVHWFCQWSRNARLTRTQNIPLSPSLLVSKFFLLITFHL